MTTADQPVQNMCARFGHLVCKPGFVYFSRYADRIKIGFTTGAPLSRLRAIDSRKHQHGQPLHALQTNCAHGLEVYVHEQLRAYRTPPWSELFRLGVPEMEWVYRLSEFNGAPIEHLDLRS